MCRGQGRTAAWAWPAFACPDVRAVDVFCTGAEEAVFMHAVSHQFLFLQPLMIKVPRPLSWQSLVLRLGDPHPLAASLNKQTRDFVFVLCCALRLFLGGTATTTLRRWPTT